MATAGESPVLARRVQKVEVEWQTSKTRRGRCDDVPLGVDKRNRLDRHVVAQVTEGSRDVAARLHRCSDESAGPGAVTLEKVTLADWSSCRSLIDGGRANQNHERKGQESDPNPYVSLCTRDNPSPTQQPVGRCPRELIPI